MDHGLYGSPMENAVCPVCCSTQDERGSSTVGTTAYKQLLLYCAYYAVCRSTWRYVHSTQYIHRVGTMPLNLHARPRSQHLQHLTYLMILVTNSSRKLTKSSIRQSHSLVQYQHSSRLVEADPSINLISHAQYDLGLVTITIFPVQNLAIKILLFTLRLCCESFSSLTFPRATDRTSELLLKLIGLLHLPRGQ